MIQFGKQAQRAMYRPHACGFEASAEDCVMDLSGLGGPCTYSYHIKVVNYHSALLVLQ